MKRLIGPIDWYHREDPAAALRLAAVMSWFWALHGHYTEGRQRLRQLLGLVSGEKARRWCEYGR